MVLPAGAPGGARRVFTLNSPRLVQVRTRPPDRAPRALRLAGRWQEVLQVQDCWRIVDEWWRQEIRRHYYRIVLTSGQLLTVFHDPLEDAWYAQPYGGSHFR